MCGRIVLTTAPHLLAERFFLDQVPDLVPSFNIPPGGDVAAVLPNPNSEGRLIHLLKWGLDLPWMQGPQPGPKLINARSETVTEKPAFREAFLHRRCLVPADGFYEWQKRAGGTQPYYFSAKDRQPLALAALWASHEYPGGRRVDSCTVLTTAANSLMRPVHHRMPVILPPEKWQAWLDLTQDPDVDLQGLLKPVASDILQSWPVTREVGQPAFDRPQCIEPVWDDPDGQLNLFG